MNDPEVFLHFMRPAWLLWGIPAIPLAWMLWRQGQRAGDWTRVIDARLLPYLAPDAGTRAGHRRRILWCALLGWLLAAVAAAGPSLKQIPQPVEQVQDALVLVLDLSYSMKAADQAPSRLDRARQKLLDLLQQRDEGQTGLVAYAGDAHVVTPLTDDTATIANLLPALNPDMMPLPGSNTSAAIALALDLLTSAGTTDGRLLLLTDGLSEAESRRVEELLEGASARLSILAFGTRSGAPMPLPRGGFVRDDSGAIVMPGLDEAQLTALAAATGGLYSRLRVDDSDLRYLLSQPVLNRETRLAENRSADAWEDQGYWLIVALLPLALALFRRGWLLTLVPVLFFSQPAPVHAGLWEDLWLTPDQQGQNALEADDPERAAALFRDPDWKATAAYQSGDFERAAELFAAEENADSWYNRGNALARNGQLEAAINAYRRSLELEPDKDDAKANLALLEALQRQQEQAQEPGESAEQEPGNSPPEQGGGDAADPSDKGGDAADDAPPQDPGREPEGKQRDPDGNDNATAGASPEEETAPQEGEQRPAENEQPAQPGSLQNVPVPELSMEEAERNQAMEQWLRRVPDDPSGLLREKFRYESRKRQQQPGTGNDVEW